MAAQPPLHERVWMLTLSHAAHFPNLAHRLDRTYALESSGRPPTTVTHELCNIASVFAQLSAIKTNPDCTAGCAQGSGQCPADWYPGAACVLPPPAFPRSAGA